MVSTSNGTTPFDVRRAGVLLHVTSLPPSSGTTGRGTLGEQAYRFVDFLSAAGVTVWQVLPLVPVHEEELSPYNALSAMAGNPDLIDRRRQADSGLSDSGSLTSAQRAEYGSWCEAHASWLEPYAEYSVLRDLFGRRDWQDWEPGLRDRDPARLEEVLTPHAARLEQLRFEQWVFDSQWAELRAYAAQAGILFFGDLPIFVAAFSADVWANREMFELDAQGRPITVTGVPPDYFAVDGQRWNNPHYAWDRMAADDFAWWRARIARQRELFDLVRIDHFRGFEAAWHVPLKAKTAREGHWVKGPGSEVVRALVETAGEGTLVAEDLGVITPEVTALRDDFRLPGMKILQFAYNDDPKNPYLPKFHGKWSVVYTGTHDNDTTLGWWEGTDKQTRAKVLAAVPDPDEAMPWALIRLALSSTARLVVVPAQDLLELGTESRMNVPGVADGNWAWQAVVDAFDDELSQRVHAMVAEADRIPD